MTSINSDTKTLSSLTAKTGFGGLVSGLDIDELVESLTLRSREKITKQQQNIQKLEWKQDAYRSVTTALKEFQSKYLDVLSPTNFRSTSFFNTINANSSSEAITVTSTAKASEGCITIDYITQLATQQKITMADGSVASKTLTSTKSVTDFIMNLEAGEAINFNLDGKFKLITFDEEFVSSVTSDPSTFEYRFQDLIDEAYGVKNPADRIITVKVGDIGSPDEGLLTLTATGSKLALYSIGESSTLDDLGFIDGQSNKITLNMALKDLTLATELEEVENYSFKINNTSFTFHRTDTLATVIQKVNASNAGVTLSYSSITDRFTITADESGAGNNIIISETNGNLMTALGLTESAGAKIIDGVNAILSVNGQQIIRSSNTIEIDGVNITLNDKSAEAITINMTENASSLLDPIKNFVEDYNSMVDLINGLIKETIERDYQPLTEAQKKEMTESEISAWEKKAKSGILRGDSILRNISTKLQSVVTGLSVNGVSLYSMGISSAGYSENGKLEIDEIKLKEALKTKGSELRALFTSNNGIGNALNDIIINATKTSGVRGSRGSLVEVAGVVSTMSDKENSIYEQIKRINKNITVLQNRLTNEESRLWNKFSALEAALQRLNVQSSILTQFSNGPGQ
ncbi:MAG TPA: flagellar filament capping protein FliD [Clostridiales bacterium]|nr:flagellar filament capping protein FliD [Clostridiales bacterium]